MMGAKMPTFKDIIESQITYKQINSDFLSLQDQTANLPGSFDSRIQFPNCQVMVNNQGQCGSCWAFASSQTFSYNLCTANDGTFSYMPSVQKLVDCVKKPDTDIFYGCNGGHQRDALNYIKTDGITNSDCMPYEGKANKCRSKCSNEYGRMTNLKCSRVVGRFGSVDRETIKQAIYKYGAVTTAFFVYQDLSRYSGGVYEHTYGSKLGGHAITVIGWGVENGKEYWLTQNSWGPWWGEAGYWKHSMNEQSDAKFFGVYGYWYCAQQQSMIE